MSRPKRGPRTLASGALSGVLLLLACPGRAQESDPEQEAQRSFEAGVALANRARWSAAEAAFGRSSTLKPVAATWINLAAVRVRLGRVNGALEALDRLDALPPESIAERQRERAAEVRREAMALAAKRELHVTPVRAALRVDGSLIKGSGATRSLILDPGRHVLTLEAEGFVSQEISLEAEPGSEETIDLSLEPRRLPPPPRTTIPVPDPLRPLPAAEQSSSIWVSPWFWTGVGATVTTAIVLAVLKPWAAKDDVSPSGGSLHTIDRPPAR